MADNSKIEWCDATWNPIIGCSKVSPGCANCYAEKMAKRIAAMAEASWDSGEGRSDSKDAYASIIGADGRWNCRTALIESALTQPFKWKKPRRIFVVSMGDLFHESVPFEWIDRVFAVMALCPQHTFQVLTKRPERMANYFYRCELREKWSGKARDIAVQDQTRSDAYIDRMRQRACNILRGPIALPNVWLGTTIENQEQADKRIPHLLATPAAVRFLSCEPLLGDIKFYEVPLKCEHEEAYVEPDTNFHVCSKCDNSSGLERIDWVIVGGESGTKASPMHPGWAISIRDQCQADGVPFFFKQWGEWAPTKAKPTRGTYTGGWLFLKPDGRLGCQVDWWDAKAQAVDRVGKHAAGRLLDGVEHNGMPHGGETRGSGEGEKRP